MNKILIIILILLNSCSLFKSKDQLLTEKEWILFQTMTTKTLEANAKLNFERYTKTERKLVMNFHEDGTVDITQDNGEKYATVPWSWKTTKKKYFRLHKGKYHGDFHITRLDDQSFAYAKVDLGDERDDITEINFFQHPDDDGWLNEKQIEMLEDN